MLTSQKIRPYIIIAILVALAHFPLLLMDGIYWDDWVLRQFILDGNFGGHFTLWEELGLPGYAVIYWLIGHLGPRPEIAHNIITFLLLIGSSLLTFSIGKHLRLETFEAAIVAVAAGVYAALEATFVFNVTVYVLMLLLFLGGVLLGLKGKKWWAMLLFVICFQHSSLLVFYGGFLLLIVLKEGSIHASIRKNILYILLPIVFWIGKELLTESVGYYNSMNFALSNIQSGFLGFMSKGVAEQGRELLRVLHMYPIMIGIAVIIAVVWQQVSKATVRFSDRSALRIFGFGVLLLFLGIAPYILVSKGPRAHGYTTRHALLIAIPIGVMILGSIKLLWQRGKAGQLVATVLLGTACAGSTLALWENYNRWQQRWIKDRSVMTYFADHPELKSIGTFIVDDQFRITAETYRYYEWSGIIRDAWGIPGYGMFEAHDSFEAIAEIGEFHPHWKQWYHLDGYPRSNCRANFVIQPGEVDSLEYLKVRLLGSEEEMQALLRNATNIDLSKLAGCV